MSVEITNVILNSVKYFSDYMCIAMIDHRRQKLLGSDNIDYNMLYRLVQQAHIDVNFK